MYHRADIQALRGVAVGLVLLDHFDLGPFDHGYLGVDVFFVLSGFLITGIIARDMESGVFSFAHFYLRRAKRLLPAAYCVIFLSYLGSFWFLDAAEQADLRAQVAGALTYTTNIVLWLQVGYFDAAAASKPLLHLWSLAIEEQFYVLFPALLYLLSRRWSLIGLTILGLTSFAVCIHVGSISRSTAFYLLPFRAWELVLGAIGALALVRGWRTGWTRALFWPAGIAILAIPATRAPHPGVGHALVCLATLVIILADREDLTRLLPTRALARIGDISYSLYLVHWPIIVFVQSSAVSAPLPEVRVAGLLASLVIAGALYWCVEQPFRRMHVGPQRFSVAAMAAALVIALVGPAADVVGLSARNVAHYFRPNYGLDKACDSFRFKNDRVCRTAEAPQTMVWGDSYAMMVASGAHRHLKDGMAQATYSACPPFIGYAPYTPGRDNAIQRARYCIDFNDQVLNFVKASPSLTTIVLSASFGQYTVGGYEMARRDGDGNVVIEPSDLNVTRAILGKLVGDLEKFGKHVIVVAPPPIASAENVACGERLLSDRSTVGAGADCVGSAATFRAGSATLDALMASVESAGATLIRLADAMCDEDVCVTVIDGKPLYRNPGHLTYVGAAKVFDRLSSLGLLPAGFD